MQDSYTQLATIGRNNQSYLVKQVGYANFNPQNHWLQWINCRSESWWKEEIWAIASINYCNRLETWAIATQTCTNQSTHAAGCDPRIEQTLESPAVQQRPTKQGWCQNPRCQAEASPTPLEEFEAGHDMSVHSLGLLVKDEQSRGSGRHELRMNRDNDKQFTGV